MTSLLRLHQSIASWLRFRRRLKKLLGQKLIQEERPRWLREVAHESSMPKTHPNPDALRTSAE